MITSFKHKLIQSATYSSILAIPNRLRRGDVIGVVSPSEAVTSETKPQLDRGVKFLQGLGFEVALGKNALEVAGDSAGTPEQRAGDINTMFADKKVKAIICSQGGTTARACLPLLDWDAITGNPKIFMGISDNTVLLNPIHAKTGLVTFHGNDVMWGFGRKPSKYDSEEFLNRLVRGKIGLVRSSSERSTVREGVASGKLWGGNLGSLLQLAEIGYLPDLSSDILFIEAYSPTPRACETIFRRFEEMGLFEKVGGVVVGHIYGLQAATKGKVDQMEDVLLSVTREYDFPILKTNDFGHNCPNTVIPIGVRANLDADNQEVEILEPCVR